MKKHAGVDLRYVEDALIEMVIRKWFEEGQDESHFITVASCIIEDWETSLKEDKDRLIACLSNEEVASTYFIKFIHQHTKSHPAYDGAIPSGLLSALSDITHEVTEIVLTRLAYAEQQDYIEKLQRKS